MWPEKQADPSAPWSHTSQEWNKTAQGTRPGNAAWCSTQARQAASAEGRACGVQQDKAPEWASCFPLPQVLQPALQGPAASQLPHPTVV